MKTGSLKHESILKQFYVYFLVASVMPLIIFLYLIFKFFAQDRIPIGSLNFKILIGIAAFLSVLGFWGTRSFLIRITALSNKLKQSGSDKLSKEVIMEMAQGDTEVAHLAKIFGEITSKLEENVKELEQTKKTLYRVLSRVGNAIASVENFDLLIQFILETTIEALGALRGTIYYLDANRLVLKAVAGFSKDSTPPEIKIGEEAVGWVAKEKKPLLVPSLEEKEGNSIFSPPLIATPLIVHDRIFGVLTISGKKEGEKNFNEDELKILSNLGYQIAVSFENAKLNTEFERTYFETISALALAVEAKDPYSRGHSERVSDYAIKIAQKMNLAEEHLKTLRDAAKLHDIGKIGIADEILKKQSKLNEAEIAIMHKHPLIGEGIVKPLRTFQHILNPVKHHHEFLDGSGYPDGLTAEEIPLITRILTIADIYDALTTDRPYRKALSIDNAKRELDLMSQAGKVDNSVLGVLYGLIDEKVL